MKERKKLNQKEMIKTQRETTNIKTGKEESIFMHQESVQEAATARSRTHPPNNSPRTGDPALQTGRTQHARGKVSPERHSLK